MLISIASIEEDLRVRIRDVEKERWSDVEMHSAVQAAIGFWHMRVGFYFDDATATNPTAQLDDGFTFQSIPEVGPIVLLADVSVDADALWHVSGITDGSCGHLRFGSEYIRFSNSSEDLLLGVERIGTPGLHSSGDAGEWQVYYDHPALLDTLARNAIEMLSLMFNSDGSPNSTQHHQWSARFADLRSDSWWRQYVPNRTPIQYEVAGVNTEIYGGR